MGRIIKKALLALLLIVAIGVGVVGWKYIPWSANWPLSPEITQGWVEQTPGFHAGIQQVYEHHQVVAIGDYHWNDKVMAEVNNLLASPDFLGQVKQVVVEFGNARYQKQLDAYLNGETDDANILNKVRREALFFTAWMPEVYGEFFEVIRAYNLSVPEAQKVKVWLAESPFYWERIETYDQWKQAADHKTNGFLNAAQQAIATGDKVLMVFGAFHLLNIEPQPESGALPLATLLKHAYPNKIFTVWPITEPEINQALVQLNAPALLSTEFVGASRVKMVDILPKAKVRLGRLNHQDDSVAQLVDGLLYVGESQRLSQFPPSMMADVDWLNEMEMRLSIVGGKPLSAFKQILANSQY